MICFLSSFLSFTRYFLRGVVFLLSFPLCTMEKDAALGPEDMVYCTLALKPLKEVLYRRSKCIALESLIYSLAYSPSQNGFLIGLADGSVRFMEGGEEKVQMFNHSNGVRAVCFSPNGKTILTGSDDGIIRLWDLASGYVLKEHLINKTKWIRDVAYSPAGETVLAAVGDTAVLLNVFKSQTAAKMFNGHKDLISSISFNPQGDKFLTGSSEGKALLWDSGSGDILREFAGHKSSIENIPFSPIDVVAFSPNGKTILTGGRDKKALLWECETGKLLLCLEGHTDWVTSASFSPTGDYVLTGSCDNTARLWDVQTGKELQKLEQNGSITAVAFSPDGTGIIIGSADGILSIWERSCFLPVEKIRAVERLLAKKGLELAFIKGPGSDELFPNDCSLQ